MGCGASGLLGPLVVKLVKEGSRLEHACAIIQLLNQEANLVKANHLKTFLATFSLALLKVRSAFTFCWPYLQT